MISSGGNGFPPPELAHFSIVCTHSQLDISRHCLEKLRRLC
jgi:hypothetical protein